MLPAAPRTPDEQPAELAALRDQLSSFRALLALSTVMTSCENEDEILHLATTAVPSLARARAAAVWLDLDWRTVGPVRRPAGAAALRSQLMALPARGGAVATAGDDWGWAYPLSTLGGTLGFLVVAAGQEPPSHEHFMLGVLAQDTGVALASARSHEWDRAVAEELRRTNLALRRSTDIHARLTAVAAAGGGRAGIATAVHELTGLGVVIEDRHGNLAAWAGTDPPDPYPKPAPAQREQLLRRVRAAGGTLSERGRLIALAAPRDEVLGVIALIDPAGAAGDAEQVALEHGATVLAMELAHLRGLAETDLRRRRDLVENLLSGDTTEHARARAQTLGYDLARPHRVVIVECCARPGSPTTTLDAAFDAVRRAARDLEVGTLVAPRAATVVVLCDAEADWDKLRSAVLGYLSAGTQCRIGVGGTCQTPEDLPRSLHQAELALRVQHSTQSRDQVTDFETLGIYRMLSEVPEQATVEEFVRRWLGPLLDYDQRKDAGLVETLSAYLECGGSYAETSTALSLHRSTLRYRLQRLREVSDLDLKDPDVRFNLQLATRAWGTLRALREP